MLLLLLLFEELDEQNTWTPALTVGSFVGWSLLEDGKVDHFYCILVAKASLVRSKYLRRRALFTLHDKLNTNDKWAKISTPLKNGAEKDNTPETGIETNQTLRWVNVRERKNQQNLTLWPNGTKSLPMFGIETILLRKKSQTKRKKSGLLPNPPCPLENLTNNLWPRKIHCRF